MRHKLILTGAGSLLLMLILAALNFAAPATNAAPPHPLAAAPLHGALGGIPTPSPTPACGLAWRRVASPNVGTGGNYLYDIAAIGPNDAWAVGEIYNQPPPSDLLALHWNGSQWNPVPFPTPWVGTLWSVDGTAANDVWAVGLSGEVAHWDGSTWSMTTTGTIPNGGLYGVVALTPNNAWAAGSSGTTTAVTHWNGATWSTVASPNPPGATYSTLGRLAAVSPTDIWSVGYAMDNANTESALIEHWNGTTWSIVPGPSLGAGNYRLLDVTAVAANDVWAVGSLNGTNGFILHWNGSQWSLVPHPGTFVSGITALAANDIWAVGVQMEHWNGSAWTIAATPVPNGVLLAADAVGPNDVWAAGIDTSVSAQTLTERYNNPCLTPTPPPASPTATRTTPTPTRTAPAPSPTHTSGPPQATNTPGPSPTPTPCAITFTDVDANNPFYPYIRCLACRQIVSGYADGTFRWGNQVTRGQTAKIVANAAGFTDAVPSNQQTFTDILPNSTFWLWIERLAGRRTISGYTCGGPGEPCDGQHRPYFRAGNDVTRGQFAKIVAESAGYADPVPTTRQTFADVPPTQPFWLYIERVAGRGVISGYTCGGPGEPCDPAQRPYFRPGASATRGQSAKITAQAFFPNCSTPLRQ